MDKLSKSKRKNKNEYLSSVTLMILSKDLDPDFITCNLKIIPDQQWKCNEQYNTVTSKIKGKYKWGGWKKYIPKKYESKYLEEQINYWCLKLQKKKNVFKLFKEKNYYCCLNCFITTEETASIIFNNETLKILNEIGLEIHISYWTNYPYYK